MTPERRLCCCLRRTGYSQTLQFHACAQTEGFGPLDLAGGGQDAKIQPDAKIGHPMMTAVAKKARNKLSRGKIRLSVLLVQYAQGADI